MKVLVLGATGMLGHTLLRRLGGNHQVVGTIRGKVLPAPLHGASLLTDVEAGDSSSIQRALSHTAPDVVVNCIGLIKQLNSSRADLVEINAAFPHRLWGLCQQAGARLVHLSTDCVFSGREGNYSEASFPDPVDDYGRSKLLGEIEQGALTLRTSIVGREIASQHGLVEWFYAQREGTVKGFRHAIYSGLTSLELCRVLEMVIERHPELEGVWQVSSEPIAKLDLLQRINQEAALGVTIEVDDHFRCDRSLDGGRFADATGYRAPDWGEMIREMVQDGKRYYDA